MSHRVYKIDIKNSPHYDFQPDSKHDTSWHLLAVGADDARIMCSYLAIGAAGEVEVETKTVERGGVTCPDCLTIIRAMKAIKL